MQEIAISELQAKCLAVLEQVRATKKPIRITRFGKPVAWPTRKRPFFTTQTFIGLHFKDGGKEDGSTKDCHRGLLSGRDASREGVGLMPGK
jgi:antitoxin (DNA-binding transcriptional repressor) of toxin-antitoxin stability system